MTKSRDILMVFVKNPELGKVKTRLAQTVGEEKALEVYLALLQHTLSISVPLSQDKAVFYSEYIDDGDAWAASEFHQYLQAGKQLGERMQNAFALSFRKQFQKVIIIGSDCYELTTEIIEKAFKALDEHEVVIGPAKDGGYYLLGMKQLHHQLFENKSWSTENVLLDTLLDLQELNLPYVLLPTLSDIDREEDLYTTELITRLK